MSEHQGTGGMDGGCMGHTRAKSDGDAVPAEPTVDARSTQAPADEETDFTQVQSTQPLKRLPRFAERTPQRPPPRGDTPTVSRNPSSCSARSKSPSLAPRGSPSSPRAHRPLEPPVTKATLSELDVGKIIHNPKLRHDINFDPELHFRPNLDGEKGRRKQEKSEQFWASLREQLMLFVTDREGFLARYGRNEDWCLPLLLRAVKDIIQTLVPSRDRDFLDEGLNVELLMQQFNRGTADLEKLASWLSSVLKLHCAPMRDEWVDEMYRELSNGNRNNDIGELVKGMRSLLSVLEAMKLDVANHQIRCLRPMLIEDTVHFEQRFFFKKMQSRRLEIGSAKVWYRDAVRQYSAGVSGELAAELPTPQELHHSFGDMDAFFYGVSTLMLPSTPVDRAPSTFCFDEERILKLRSDAVDAICLDVCMRQYEDLERVSRLTRLMPSFGSGSLLPPMSVPAYVVMDEDSVLPSSFLSRPSSEFNFNTPPSRPSSLALSVCGSATSSPRNSGGIFAPVPAPTQTDTADARAKTARLYSSLVALLQTSAPVSATRPGQRWQAMVPSIAVEILRFTNTPPDLLPVIEKKLAAQLCDCNHDRFMEAQDSFHSRLFTELSKKVREFKNLSGLGLFSVATGSRLYSHNRLPEGNPQMQFERSSSNITSTSNGSFNSFGGGGDHSREAREDHGIEDMASRIAHLGLVHWRVWSQLAYSGDDIDAEDSVEMNITIGTT